MNKKYQQKYSLEYQKQIMNPSDSIYLAQKHSIEKIVKEEDLNSRYLLRNNVLQNDKKKANIQQRSMTPQIQSQFSNTNRQKPTHYIRTSKLLKSLDYLQNIKEKSMQKHAIKAYNNVNHKMYKPLIDDPKIATYIINAMKQCNNYNRNCLKDDKARKTQSNSHRNEKQSSILTFLQSNKNEQFLQKARLAKKSPVQSIRASPCSSPLGSPQKQNIPKSKKQNPQRRSIKKLGQWISCKMKQHKNEQKLTGTLITQRIHALHLAFSQICRHTGQYSQQLAQILTSIHSHYHKMYQTLINCLMHQNLSINKSNQQLQQKINKIVLHYEQQLLNIRVQYDKRSSKVIQNFHKCINMKQQLEADCGRIGKQLKVERGRLNFMEDGLAKAIQILLEIGEEKFRFLSTQQEKTILSLGWQYNNKPENYKLFHKWCSTILKIVANMKEQSIKQKKQKQKQKQKQHNSEEQHIKYLRKFTLSAIGKFMIDFDPSLSVKDAENILIQFMATHTHKQHKQVSHLPFHEGNKVQLNKKQPVQEKIDILQYEQKLQSLYPAVENESQYNLTGKKQKKQTASLAVPNLHDISQKFKGDDKQTQINNLFESCSKSIQTVQVETADFCVVAKPRQKTKQTSTLPWIRQKFKQVRIPEMNLYIWAQRDSTLYKSSQGNDNKNSKIRTLRQTVSKKIPLITALSSLNNSGGGSRRSQKRVQIKTESQIKTLTNKDKIKSPRMHQQQKNENTPIIALKQQAQQSQQSQHKQKQKQIENIPQQHTKIPKNSIQILKKQKNVQKRVTFKNKKIQQNEPVRLKQAQLNLNDQIQMYSDSKILNTFVGASASGVNSGQIGKRGQNGEQFKDKDKDKDEIKSKSRLFQLENAINGRVVMVGDEKIDKKQRKSNKSLTTFCLKRFQSIQNELDSSDEQNISKSYNFIRDSNDYLCPYIKKRAGIFKDLDMLVEDIITRRKFKIKRKGDRQSQQKEEKQKQKQRYQQFGDKLRSNIGLDIHGHHINLQSQKNHINNKMKSGVNNFSNLLQPNNKQNEKQTIMLDLLKSPKKSQKTQQFFLQNKLQQPVQFQYNSHSFLIQLIELLQQKNRKITESTMWNHKKSAQIQKFIHKLHLSKQRIMATSNNLQAIWGCITHYIDPMINAYVRMYCHLVQAENSLASSDYKNNLMTGRKLCYHHRLAPLLHILINSISLSTFGLAKCTKYITTFYKGIKNLKSIDRSLEIYQELIQGKCVQLDVFVKIIYYLSQNKSIKLQNQFIMLSIVQLQLFFILDGYLTPGQVNNLILQIRGNKMVKKMDNQNNGIIQYKEDKVSLHYLSLKILKSISQKKNNLTKKYKPILQIFGQQNQSISYNDLVYFIQAFPTDKQTRKKLIYQTSFYLIYWDKKQPSIPQDRLVFLFQSIRFISNEALQKNLIVEYFKIKCERQLRSVSEKIMNNSQYVVDSIYKLLYRVPPMIYRLTQDIKVNKSNKKNIPILTVIYNMIIEDQLEKVYMSGYLNALAAIPLCF